MQAPSRWCVHFGVPAGSKAERHQTTFFSASQTKLLFPGNQQPTSQQLTSTPSHSGTVSHPPSEISGEQTLADLRTCLEDSHGKTPAHSVSITAVWQPNPVLLSCFHSRSVVHLVCSSSVFVAAPPAHRATRPALHWVVIASHGVNATQETGRDCGLASGDSPEA